MDGQRFDQLARSLAFATSRRTVLKAMVGIFAGTIAGSFGGFLGAGFHKPAAAATLGCCTCAGERGCQAAQNENACTTVCGTKKATFNAKQTCQDEKKCVAQTSTTTETSTGNLGCCTCAGERGCQEAQNENACATVCGTKKATFNAKQTCQDEKKCIAKTSTTTGDTEETLTATPVTAAAIDLASRDGWALQDAEAAFDGDAVKSGALTGVVPFTVTNIPEEFLDRAALVGGYRHKAVRRADTAGTPTDTSEELYVQFSTPSDIEEFEANIRGMMPPDARDLMIDLNIEGVSFALKVPGPTADIQDPAAETVSLFATAGNFAVFSTTTSTTGDVVQSYIDRDFEALLGALTGESPNPNLQQLANDTVFFGFVPGLTPLGEFAVTVLDGRTLPRDLESAAQFDFRLLTDVGTNQALRLTQVVTGENGPVAVTHEVRDLESEDAAINFIDGSAGRVQEYFGSALSVIPVTEFDALGDQGAGFIFQLNFDNGGYNGGVTGYARLGNLVAVTNVNVRTETTPSADILSLVQDGRFFANPGVAMLQHQLSVWSGESTDLKLPVFEGLLPP